MACGPGLRVIALSAALVAAGCTATSEQAGTARQLAHAQGSCGSLGPGTGLVDDRGWIVSMLPGAHALRVRGVGSVYLTAARMTQMDFDAGRPYYLALEGTNPASVLEWKVPGKDWSPVAKTFLYPPQGVTYAKQ